MCPKSAHDPLADFLWASRYLKGSCSVSIHHSPFFWFRARNHSTRALMLSSCSMIRRLLSSRCPVDPAGKIHGCCSTWENILSVDCDRRGADEARADRVRRGFHRPHVDFGASVAKGGQRSGEACHIWASGIQLAPVSASPLFAAKNRPAYAPMEGHRWRGWLTPYVRISPSDMA